MSLKLVAQLSLNHRIDGIETDTGRYQPQNVTNDVLVCSPIDLGHGIDRYRPVS